MEQTWPHAVNFDAHQESTSLRVFCIDREQEHSDRSDQFEHVSEYPQGWATVNVRWCTVHVCCRECSDSLRPEHHSFDSDKLGWIWKSRNINSEFNTSNFKFGRLWGHWCYPAEIRGSVTLQITATLNKAEAFELYNIVSLATHVN